MRWTLPALAVLAWPGVGPARADVITVYVYDFDFSVNPPGGPVQDAVVNIGDTVRWLFLDSGHSTTSVLQSPESWDSGYVGVVGTIYEHTFTHAGEWWYYCFPHGNPLPNGTASGMAGTVTVVPGPGVAAVLAGAGVAGAVLAGRRRPRGNLRLC